MASFDRSAIGAKGSDGELQPKLEVKRAHKVSHGTAKKTTHNPAAQSKKHSPKGYR